MPDTMSQSQSNHISTPNSSIHVTAKLRSDGKNWRDWHKQINNAAIAMNALDILDGSQKRPQYSPNDPAYTMHTLIHPNFTKGMTQEEKIEAGKRVHDLNQYLRPLNDDILRAKNLAESEHRLWGVRDAQLQNLLMQSVDTSLNNTIHAHQSAHTMYKALKDLHDVSDHDTLRKAWGTFVDLRAEDCKSVQDYIGRFKNALADLNNAGVYFRYKRSDTSKHTPDSNEELLATAFVHGLHRVVPDWCEARENDLRQGKTWAMDKLVASLSDHIRHSNNSTDPVKSFTTIAKQDEERRVLTRMANRTKDSNNKTHGGSGSTKSTSSTVQNKKGKDRPPVEWCDHCEKEHTGGTKLCWAANPELKPQHIKEKERRQESKQQTKAVSNVTFAKNDYDIHSYFTNNVSPSITTKATANRDYRKRYLFDTGANSHVFNDRTKFISYDSVGDSDVAGATGSATVTGRGTVALKVVLQDGRVSHIHLSNVLHCPEFATNVISQAPFKRKGAYYHSGEDKLYDKDDQELAYLPEIDGIPNFLVIECNTQAPAALAYASLVAYRSSHSEPTTSRTASEWHHIFGHASHDIILRTAKVVKGMIIKGTPELNCRPCGLSKSKETISRRPQRRPQQLLGMIHVDLVGPITTTGIDGEKYWMIITDGRSRRRWVFTSDSKAVLGTKLVQWAKQMKTKHGLRLITIRCDNAREILNARNQAYFDEEGVTIEPSPPYEPNSNGMAERANGITATRVRSALIAAGLPEKLWPYAVKYMIRLLNLSVTNGTDGNITPHEVWHSEMHYPNPIPNVANTQAFGHTGYVLIPLAKRIKGEKFAPRAVRGHLVGMIGESIYEMWIPETNKVITTSSVNFEKYGTASSIQQEEEISPPGSPMLPQFGELPDIATGTGEIDELMETITMLKEPIHQRTNEQETHNSNAQTPRTSSPHDMQAPLQDCNQTTRGNNRAARRAEIDADLRQENIVHTRRQRRQPERFAGITFVMARCFATAIMKPTVGSKLSDLPPEPRNYRDFKKHIRRQQLQTAMDAEYAALLENKTWRPATADEISNHKAIPAQWVWTYKGDADGYHVKDKARMVACGNRQDHSDWHEEVYSYVVRISTLRILLAIVAAMDWECEQIDMITAYLNSHLDNDDIVLLTLPPGCPQAKKTVRLLRGMYGLRQSALLWYNELKASLKEMGFHPIEADQCVFIHQENGHIIIVYVDDILLITKDKPSMTKLKEELLKRYKSRDLGPVGFYLGIRIVRDRKNRAISLTMDSYFDRLADEYHLQEAPAVYTPLPKSAVKITKRPDNDKADEKVTNHYQSLVAKLLYPAQIARPDIAWSVNFLARFASNPTDEQLALLRRVVVYCKTNATLGITYKYNPNIHQQDDLGLSVYSDAAYADNLERKSSAGYVAQLLNAPVSFKAYRQRIVTSSSTEAEFVALTYAAKEAAWIRRLLQQVGYHGNDIKPTALYSDNLPAIQLVKNPGHHERTKHIDIAYKYVREEYYSKNITVKHIAGVDMPADGLTKPLDKTVHAKFIQLLGLSHIPRARGRA